MAVGCEVEMDYWAGLEKAHEHFQLCEQDWQHEQLGSPAVKMDTVEDACRAHVENIRAQKGNEAAQGAANMYKPVYSHWIGKVRLRHLSGNDVREWRNQLVTEARPKKRARGKRGANRLFRQFAAALSYAKVSGAISSDEAWKKVGQFPVKDGNRPSYLSIVQRRALLLACERDKVLRSWRRTGPQHVRICCIARKIWPSCCGATSTRGRGRVNSRSPVSAIFPSVRQSSH